MALKSQELQSGCFHNAREDEPLFVLRANDKFAPELVEAWANKVEMAVTGHVTVAADKSREKIKYARALAHQMRAWQTLNTSKIPD